MKTCVFAGTFDPITTGHMDIIERSLKLFDCVHVVIMDNPNKQPMFTLEERLNFIKEATAGLQGVQVCYHGGLMIDYMKSEGITTVVRGVRNSTDFDYERLQEDINKHLYPELEVVYLGSNPEFMHISSSFVRELMRYKKDFSLYIPFDY